ncbi:MAG: hypothetical protein EBQ87_11835 [Planctomycetes bacterium]|nr:hypothetical protein [Planctomycetota bacterium]
MKVATSVKQALDNKKAVVALESSVISQGLAYPKNLEIALHWKIAFENKMSSLRLLRL